MTKESRGAGNSARVLVLDWRWFAEVLSLGRCSSTLHANELWILYEDQKRAESGSPFHFLTQMVLMACMTFLEKWHN